VPDRGYRGNCADHGRSQGAWCKGRDLVDRPFRPDQGESDEWEVPAFCWYTLAYLTDLMVARGETPPPLAFIATPEGGTMIEQWTDFGAQMQCANMTCLCSTPGCNQSQPLDPITCWGNGGLYRSNILPYVNTTIKSFLWYQAENNEGTDAGNFLDGTGYSCAIKAMVAQWRQIWSVVPGTTDPMAPFGFVTIADGTEEGWGLNAANIHWAQTANFGSVPNPALPNTFMALAHDAGDPWDADPGGNGCGGQLCCVDTYLPLGPKCVGDHRGQCK
jgi:sialate O-acetylesterase